MTTINEIRLANLRALMEEHGATNLAVELGYSQPSFLSQMAGPTPSREITEKTARKFEKSLGLETGYFDRPLPPDHEDSVIGSGSVEIAPKIGHVVDLVRLLGAIYIEEEVVLVADKFAEVFSLAYTDAMEHGITPRPDYIRQLVRLLK